MIWKKRPTETDVATLSSKIGTVPSGKTIEGQITELNSKIGNYGMYTDDSVTASKLPSEFNVGTTYTSTGSTSTFPKTYGFVWTNKYSDNRVTQINFGNGQIVYRFSTASDVWGNWYDIGLTIIN